VSADIVVPEVVPLLGWIRETRGADPEDSVAHALLTGRNDDEFNRKAGED
jgi:hypothetical protein